MAKYTHFKKKEGKKEKERRVGEDRKKEKQEGKTERISRQEKQGAMLLLFMPVRAMVQCWREVFVSVVFCEMLFS